MSDTTIYDRSRSSKVELLSKVYDHCAKEYLNGFRMMTLGWSDGATFIPFNHAVLISPKEKNRIQGIKKIMDRRSCGARRRQGALVKSTELIVPMVKLALNLSIPAKYLLMDSWWFSGPGWLCYGTYPCNLHSKEHLESILRA
jgi:hypothetical protein